MTEISKMFENAGFPKKQCKDYSCIVCEQNNSCEKYPPFTADKQIEIICFLINRGVELSFKCEQGKINTQAIQRSLAGLINNLWQSLTVQEKEEIRGVLNE